MNPTRRISWSFVLSAVLHTSLVAGLLYASVTQITTPTAAVQPMSVTLVAPAPPPVAPQPQPAEPETTPETLPEAVEPIAQQVEPEPEPPAPVQQPKPLPKQKPKPVSRPAVKVPPKDIIRPAAPAPAAIERQDASVRPAVSPPAAAAATKATSAPQTISFAKPAYSERARALGIEGTVKIQFDVNSDGLVENLQIISATPRNMFERDIRQASRRWRYESGKPTKNMMLTIQFKLTGVSSVGD